VIQTKTLTHGDYTTWKVSHNRKYVSQRDHTFIKIVNIQGVEINGRNCQIVMENKNSCLILIDHSDAKVRNIRVGKELSYLLRT
jgi:hypothetical protein